MKFNKILLFIIIVISNYSIADNIFEPNQLPNIEIIENKILKLTRNIKINYLYFKKIFCNVVIKIYYKIISNVKILK